MVKVVHLFMRVKTLPLYAYRCTQCGHKFEKIQNFSAQPESECPRCQGVLERPLTAPRFHFKGAGWYVNDYAAKSSEPASESGSEKDGKVESISASADSKAPATASETSAAAPAASAPAPASSSSTPAS
jgi:putative FmdB family regulatory protein